MADASSTGRVTHKYSLARRIRMRARGVEWKSVRLLIVDMDNTLCDTFHTLSARQWELVASSFEKRGEKDIARGIRSRFGRESFVKTLRELHLTDEQRRFAVRVYDRNPVGSLRLFPDAHALLELAVPKALLSRGEPALQRRKIRHLGIARHFDDIVIVDTFRTKTQAIKDILKRHEARPGDALIIGDRIEEEIADGRRLGVPTALVRRRGWKPGKHVVEPDVTVRSLETIAKRLRPVARGGRTSL